MKASPAEQHVFGTEAQIHPVTKMALETGCGALPHDQQAQIHCHTIEHHHGKKAADEMRAKLKAAADLVVAEAELGDEASEIEHHGEV